MSWIKMVRILMLRIEPIVRLKFLVTKTQPAIRYVPTCHGYLVT